MADAAGLCLLKSIPFRASRQYRMKVFGKRKGYKMELGEAGY
jgi:hypothetical protein